MDEFKNWIGRSEARHDVVTPGAMARYCATVTGADIYGSDEQIVPPGFHWCLCLPDCPLSEIGADGHPRKGGFLPPIALPRRMWAASDVIFLAPLKIGAPVDRVSTVSSIDEKQGKTGKLVFVGVDHLVSSDGVENIRERQTIVYKDDAPVPAATPPCKHDTKDTPPWPIERTVTPTQVQLFRYSALSFNAHRIHYDLPYAQEVEGYPGLVVQGPMIASMLLAFAASVAGADTISRFRFRALAPAFAGNPLRLAASRKNGEVKLAAIDTLGWRTMEACAAGA